MTNQTIFDPTGTVVSGSKLRTDRSPLTPLELSRTDYVSEYFRSQGREPSYEDIAGMALPLKYVNAAFKVYPLVLGDKNGPAKVRLLSDASELHLDIAESHAGLGLETDCHWFGFKQRLKFSYGTNGPENAKPRWRGGYLPVAEFAWEQDNVHYSLEAFATVLPDTTSHLCTWLRFSTRRLTEKADATVAVAFDGEFPLTARERYLLQQREGRQLLCAGYSNGWNFDEEAQQLIWQLNPELQSDEACLVILNQPAPHGLLVEWPGNRPHTWAIDIERSTHEAGRWLMQYCEPARWKQVRDQYCNGWDCELVAAGRVETPETIVNHAHKSVRINSQIIATRNQMSYSVHNSYERMYTDESSQPIIGLAYWGCFEDAARYFGQLAFYTQTRLLQHELGLRLHWFCRYIQLSDDQAFCERNRERMQRWASTLLEAREEEHRGLAAPLNHCSDLHHDVYSLSANSLAWRGMRDFALLSNDEQLLAGAAQYQKAIIQAVEASLDRSAAPPFLPMALYGDGDEPTPDTLCDSAISAYWGLMAPYALYSGVLAHDHPGTQAMIQTFKQRCGLCSGLVRFFGRTNAESEYMMSMREVALDDLYGAKLSEYFARCDEPDQLVLALYGKLGLGLTLDTFQGGECASLAPSRIFGEESADGRSLYLPPNSACQMFFAILLRHCLVFDFDSANDGHIDTLRLAYSTPRRWLNEGEKITVEKMPTAFGDVSYTISSHLELNNLIEATLQLPQRLAPQKVSLRLRVPLESKKRLCAVWINDQPHPGFDASDETIDLSAFSREVKIRAQYSAG